MPRNEQTVAASRTIDLNHVAVFTTVVEQASFTAAAKALGLPKSSVSRAVSRLEEQLGVSLLTRTTRKLSLTDAGRAYAQRARDALLLLSEGRELVVEADQEPRGLVRITAPTDPTGNLLAGPISRFCALYPAIHVEVLFSSSRLDLVQEGIDLALRAGRLDDASLVGRRVGLTPLRLVASPAYLERRGTPKRLSDLARHDCVLFRGTHGRQRWTLTRKDKSETIEVMGPVNVDEMTFVLPLCIAGVGIGLVPLLMVEEALGRGALVPVLPQYQQQGAALHVLHPASRQLPRRVRLFRDFLYEELRVQFTRVR